jgi:hypothetical protein
MKIWVFHRVTLGALAGAGISAGLGLLLAVTSVAAPPSLSLTATDAVVGQPIHAIAQLSESPNASEEISFEVFGPGDPTCSGPALTPAPASATVNGEGEYSSGDFAPPEAGVYHWSAHYSGDAENPEADSICSAASTVEKASPGMTGTASDGQVGTAIHDEASLTGGFSPTGEVTFNVYAPGDIGCLTPLETDTAPIQGSQAISGNFIPQQVGEFRWRAAYPGDANNEPVNTACGAANQSSTVGKASPALSGLATSTVTVGSSITDSAILSEGFEAGGQIVFRAFGPGDASCGGAPKYEEAVAVNGDGAYSPAGFSPPAGVYRWTAAYSGDANNEAVSTACGAANQSSTVEKAAPTLSGLATPAAMVGSSITDSAILSEGFEAGGQIVFRLFGPDDASCAGAVKYEEAVAVDGDDAYSPAGFSPPAGGYRWTAAYSGDANNEAVSTACGAPNQSSTVGKASPTLSGLATSPVVVGSSITDSAILSEGFEAGGQIVFRAFGPGDASCTGAVKYEEAVAVNGDGAYSPAGFSPPAGVYRWRAAYSGDANNEAVSTACGAANQSSTVEKASPELAGSASAGIVGTAIHDEVTVIGGFSPGGEVTFSVYGPTDTGCLTPLETDAVPIQAGHATSGDFSPQQAGEFRWRVSYPGDANNEPVSTPCGAPNQSSTVGKASPTLSGLATSAVVVGSPIDDTVTLAGGFKAGGQIVFRLFGPNDASCAGAVKYEATVAVNGDGSYSPAEFSPLVAGLYRWTAAYSGDANNEAISLPCGTANQASAVGTVTVTLTAGATSGTVGNPVIATASIQNGAIPKGQITFKAFSPNDVNCSGAAAFSSTVSVSGNGSYRSDLFVPPRVGAFRWTVSYSGDPNHAPATAGCGEATSTAAQARPSITSGVEGKLVVGGSFSVTATVLGGFAPAGTVSFQIYDPSAAGCAKPLAVNTVAIARNGTARSDPFVPKRPGRYSFVASYSGDASNQGAIEPCDPAAHAAQVEKRTPKVKPHARLKGGNLISIRARLSGAVSPSGVVNFRLYRPGDTRCKGKPAFNGGLSVKSNGSYLLAEYLASRAGIYRLSVGYSGDQRNRRYTGACSSAQTIRVR